MAPRGRPKGSTNKSKEVLNFEENNQQLEQLTEEQVWDVMQFGKELYNMYPNIFNPQLVNNRMQDITSNPIVAEQAKIEDALKNPKSNEEQLRGMSENFEYKNMGYKKVLSYYDNMLLFDYTYNCINADAKDMKTPSYKKDIAIVEDFLSKFKVKREFSKVMRGLMRQDAFFSVLRDDSDSQYVLQELPIRHCLLTGLWEYGYIFDFNMMWFIANPGVDINSYPSVFKEYYNRIFGDGKQNPYIPSKDIDKRTGEFVYWVQTSPEDNMWAFKFDMQRATRVPPFSPLFFDLINTEQIRTLQTNKYIISAYRLLVGKIPLLVNNKNGNVKDQLGISPELAGKFANLIKQGLPTSSIGVAFSPFETIDEHTFQKTGQDVNIYKDHLQTTIQNSGAALQSIFSTEKANVEATRASLTADSAFVSFIYEYFNDFLNYHINRRTKKYKFAFKFQGVNIPFIQQQNFDNVIQLAQSGIILPQQISAAIHMEPKDFYQQLLEGKESGFADLLYPLVTAFTQSGDGQGGTSQQDGSKGGRPTNKASDSVPEGTESNRATGGNASRKGKI